jgi:hypothetical protein
MSAQGVRVDAWTSVPRRLLGAGLVVALAAAAGVRAAAICGRQYGTSKATLQRVLGNSFFTR